MRQGHKTFLVWVMLIFAFLVVWQLFSQRPTESALHFSTFMQKVEKSPDEFKPNTVIEVRVNGKTVSSYHTKGMLFSVAQYISRMSRYVTLHPDDVIWFGCDGPTEPALRPGDLVEVVNDAIGVLANKVVAE